MSERTIPAADNEATPLEACTSCGYPLAGDQRYCLNCGQRRGEPRVDYAPYLDTGETPAEAGSPGVAPSTAPAAVAGSPAKEASPLVAVAGIALLGLMLLVGVLIGRGGGDDQSGTQNPTVLQVPNQGAQVADAAATGGATKTSGASKGGNGGGGDKGGGGGGGGGSTEPAETVSEDTLQQLENTSGDAYQKAAEQLPDTIALPGKPPPTDNKDPGGGTNATVVK